jgi:hypothetical protein
VKYDDNVTRIGFGSGTRGAKLFRRLLGHPRRDGAGRRRTAQDGAGRGGRGDVAGTDDREAGPAEAAARAGQPAPAAFRRLLQHRPQARTTTTSPTRASPCSRTQPYQRAHWGFTSWAILEKSPS